MVDTLHHGVAGLNIKTTGLANSDPADFGNVMQRLRLVPLSLAESPFRGYPKPCLLPPLAVQRTKEAFVGASCTSALRSAMRCT